MFTKRFYRVLQNHTKVTKALWGSPFEWNIKSRELIVTPKALLRFQIYAACMLSVTFYCALMTLRIKLWGSVTEIGFVMAIFGAAIVDSVFCMGFLLTPDYCASVVNAALRFGENFNREYKNNKLFFDQLKNTSINLGTWSHHLNPENARLNLYLDLICALLTIACVCCPFLMTAHYFIFPFSPAYPFVLATDLFHPLTYLAIGLIYLRLLHAVFANLTTICLLGLVYVFVLFHVLHKEFLGRSSKGYNTEPALRTRINLPGIYRQFEILHKNVNLCFEHLIIPLQTIITQLCLFCNFTIISQGQNLDATTGVILGFWSAGGLVIWTVFLTTGGYVYLQGKNTLASWKYLEWPKPDKRYMSKFKMGCRPLAIRVGGYYCVRRLSVLKFWQGIVRGTFRALLTLK